MVELMGVRERFWKWESGSTPAFSATERGEGRGGKKTEVSV